MRTQYNLGVDWIIDEINARLDRLEATRPKCSAEATQPPLKLQSSEAERAIVEQILGDLKNKPSLTAGLADQYASDSVGKDWAKWKQVAIEKGYWVHRWFAFDKEQSPMNEMSEQDQGQVDLASCASGCE